MKPSGGVTPANMAQAETFGEKMSLRQYVRARQSSSYECFKNITLWVSLLLSFSMAFLCSESFACVKKLPTHPCPS